MKRSLQLLVTVMLFFTACSSPGTLAAIEDTPVPVLTESTQTLQPAEQSIEPGPTQTQAAIALPSPTAVSTQAEATRLPGPAEEQVEIEAAGGIHLIGTFFRSSGPPPPWPGILLIHMLGSDRHSWADFAGQLVEAGFAVLAIDLRGHGETGGEADWEAAGDDVQRAWQYLADRPEVDETRTAIIGASIGANLGLAAGAQQDQVDTVVLLSPGLDYQGVTTAEVMAAFADRPVLIVASMEDAYSADSSQQLALGSAGGAQLVLYDGAGHGTAMFAGEPQLAPLILDWLDQYVK